MPPTPADDDLHGLADEFTDRMHRANPFDASLMGLTDYDAQVPDVSSSADAQLRRDLQSIQQRANSLPEPGAPTDRLVLAVLRSNVHSALLGLDNAPVEYTVTALPLAGPPVLFHVAANTSLPDPGAGADYLARLRASAGWIDGVVDRLRDGLAAGRTPVAPLAEAAIAWADDALATPVPPALVNPAQGLTWDDAGRWRAELDAIAADFVRPAFRRWRDVVAHELLPVARDEDRAGVSAIPGGAEDYRRAIEIHTTLPLTAEELHSIGLSEVERLEAEAVRLGASLGLDGLAAVHAAFAASGDPDPVSAMANARGAIRRAEAGVSAVFGPPEPPPCAVEPMPDTVADTGMAPHYTLPRVDGSRPGTYWFNTRRPTMGTGWDLEAVAFHEAVPGHHLQLARAQITTGLPRLLTQSLVTVHAEGWGLYAERLSGELGLYSGVEGQIGAVIAELLRANRLVVDTGLHAMGWSRRQAVQYMSTHVPVPAPFVDAEIDRYIAWPGQALAYLTGQREILRLREHARTTLGARFNLRGFHGAVLDNGSVPMPALATAVQTWIDATR